MFDLFVGFAIAVAGALNGHQQQMPRDVHDIPACESKANESCISKEFKSTVNGRPDAPKRQEQSRNEVER